MAIVHGIFPRKSKFSRKVAGKAIYGQIVAANFDYLFILTSLNNEFNLRRIERYLALAWESGTKPIIVLTKADLCDELSLKVAEIESVAVSILIHVISSLKGEGLDASTPYLKKERQLDYWVFQGLENQL